MTTPGNILSWLVWLPIAAGLAVLLLGDRRIAFGRWIALAASLAALALCVPLWCGLRHDDARAPVPRARALDRRPERLVLPGAGRNLAAARGPDRLHHAARRDRRLVEHREAARAVLRRVPRHGRADDRRVCRGRRAPVLRFLGGDADPDVPDHRHLGRHAARVRDHQVLPVHLPRLGADAGRARLAVSPGRQLRDRRHAAHADRHDRAGADLPGVLRRIRGEGADVAGAHLAAGRARRGADRRVGDPRRDHAEDGRLRLPALQPANRAGRQPGARLAGHHALADRDRLHRLRRAGAARHEEADRLLVDCAHGLRDARRLCRLGHPWNDREPSTAPGWASMAR